MQGNRRKDTQPELGVRRRLHAKGLRYRVDFPPLREARRLRADIVFTRTKVAVFIDGCYWHKCPDHYRPARSNADFWAKKIDGNRKRDIESNAMLRDAGWTVLRFWEHENPEQVASVIAQAIEAKRKPG